MLQHRKQLSTLQQRYSLIYMETYSRLQHRKQLSTLQLVKKGKKKKDDKSYNTASSYLRCNFPAMYEHLQRVEQLQHRKQLSTLQQKKNGEFGKPCKYVTTPQAVIYVATN